MNKRDLVIAYLDFVERLYGIQYTEAEIEFYMNKKDPVSITVVDFHTNEELGSENILLMQYMADLDKLSILCYINEELTGEIKLHSIEELIHVFKTKSLDFFTNHPIFGKRTMDTFKELPIKIPNDYIIAKEILETILGKDDGYYKAVFDDITIQFLFINDSIYLDAKEETLNIPDIDKKPTYIPDNSIVIDINGNIVSLKSKFKNMEITPISRKEYAEAKHSNTLIGFYL